MPPLALLLLGLGPGTLFFLGDQRCPNRSSIEEELTRIGPGASESKVRHLALLELRSNDLRVRLFDDQGRLLEERSFEGSRSCAEWARVAAVLLASWETDLAGPEPSFTDSAGPTAPLIVPRATSTSQSSPQVWRARALQLELGLGPMGSIAGDGSPAVGGEILAGLSAFGRPFGGQLMLSANTVRALSLAGGSARWQRLAFAIGGHGTFGADKLKLELGAALLGSLLLVTGTGVLEGAATTAEPGLGVSTRLRWDFARDWLAWLQVGTSVWLKAEDVHAMAGSATLFSAQIPAVEVFVTLGLSFTTTL